MNGADFCHRPKPFADFLDSLRRLESKLRLVLVKIDGQIILAVMLVFGNPAAGHFLQAGVPDDLKFTGNVLCGDGRMGKFLPPAVFLVENERSILSDDSVDGPLAHRHVAPARRTAGDRNHLDAGSIKFPQCVIGLGENFALVCNGVVDVMEDIAQIFCRFRF